LFVGFFFLASTFVGAGAGEDPYATADASVPVPA
jgi:hypothetical protein